MLYYIDVTSEEGARFLMIQISLVVFIHQSSIAYVNKLMQTMPCNTCNQCQFDSCYPLVLRTALCPIGMCVSTLTGISTSRTVVDMRRLSRGACVDSAGFPGISHYI